MDSRHSEPLRKRKHRLSSTLVTGVEEESWDCTVCTYKNSAEAFRCEMCQTRKGTSTRKPKLNRQIVEEQSLIARAIIKERQEEVGSGTGGSESTTPHRRKYHRHLNPSLTTSASAPSLKHGGLLRPGSLRNIDRSSSQQFEVFANGFSVIITEYYPKVSSPSTHGGRKQTLSMPYSPTLPIPSLLVAPSSTPLGNGATQVEPDCHPTPPTANHLSSPSSGGDAGGGHSNLASLNNFIATPEEEEEEEEERKTQLHVDTKDFSPDEGDPCAFDPISPSLIGQNPEVTATELRSSISATSVLCRRKRRKRRLRSELSANNPSRSLRSNTGSSAVASRSRQASRIARASLYRATNTPRPYKRRKIATPSTTNAPVESASTSEMASPINRESTAPMTDSCGAMALEMSATGAST